VRAFVSRLSVAGGDVRTTGGVSRAIEDSRAHGDDHTPRDSHVSRTVQKKIRPRRCSCSSTRTDGRACLGKEAESRAETLAHALVLTFEMMRDSHSLSVETPPARRSTTYTFVQASNPHSFSYHTLFDHSTACCSHVLQLHVTRSQLVSSHFRDRIGRVLRL